MRIVNSILYLYPLDDSSISHYDNRICLQTLSNVPWVAKLPPTENHADRWTPFFFPENLVTPPEDFLSSGFILTRPCLCRVCSDECCAPSTSQRQVEPEPSWETRGTPAELSPEPKAGKRSSSDGVSITVGLQGPHTAGKSGSFWLNSLHSSWSQRLRASHPRDQPEHNPQET